MGTEVELKLAVSPQALRRAERLPWLRKLAKAPVGRKRLVSVYYDTGKFKLREKGLTLRVRQDGRRNLQTVKAFDGGGPSARAEWEDEVRAARPDFKLARHTGLAPLINRKLKTSLRPVFTTDVRRTVIPLRVGNSDVELALDRGRIEAGRRHEAISEIELELKSGVRADLARLAKRLARAIEVSYGARAKSERGYALNASERSKPVGAASVKLDRRAAAGEAFAVVGLACLRHLAVNEDAVRAGESEGVHQMRVAVRRLRAAISIFKDMLPGGETEHVKRELKWLTERLGAARDFDVLVEEGVAPLRRRGPGRAELKLLETDLKKKRDRGFGVAKAAVSSRRYRRLVLTTALWLLDGKPLARKGTRSAAQGERAVVDFARDVLDRRTAKVGKKAKKLGDLNARDRHKLRIAVKKLRYAVDFFESLFAKRKVKRAHVQFGKVLKTLQDALGKLNDMSVHAALARRFVEPERHARARPQKAFAMGVLTGREQARAKACVKAAREAGRRLSKADRFWR